VGCMPELEAAVPATAALGEGGGVRGGVHPLVWILLAGAALRLALWAWAGDAPLSIWDERDYNALAVGLAQRGEFAPRPGQPTSIRPPLYPAVVAAIYRLAGAEDHRAVRLLQAAASLGTILLVYRLGVGLYSRRVGTWAAGLYAFYPSLLGYNNLLLTEVLFTALLCAACGVLVGAFQRDSTARLLAGGVLLGLAALTRSVVWPFPAVFGLYLLATWGGTIWQRLLAILAFGLGFAAPIAPWAVRNTRLQETPTVIDVMGGRNFMMGNYAYTPMNRAWAAIGIEGQRSWIGVLQAEHPREMPHLTQGQLDKLALRAAVRFVLEHPWLTLRRDAVKFFNFWGLERELIAGAARGYFGPVSAPVLVLLTLLIFGSYAAAMLAGIFGAAVRPPADRRAHGLLLLLIAFVCGLHTLAFGHSRYHLPLMPLVLVYAAAALVPARQIGASRGRWTFALACGLGGLLLAAWAAEVLIVDLDRFVAALGTAA
jgi:4-amino-4-deoxy-L-arabinose transferase-like glycosyltransferase